MDQWHEAFADDCENSMRLSRVIMRIIIEGVNSDLFPEEERKLEMPRREGRRAEGLCDESRRPANHNTSEHTRHAKYAIPSNSHHK